MVDEYVIIEKAALNSIGDTVRSATGSTDSIALSDLSNEVAAAVAIGSSITVDSELSATSINPVQNKVIYVKFSSMQSELDCKADTSHDHSELIATDEDIVSLLFNQRYLIPAGANEDTIYIDNNGKLYVL